MEATSCLWGHRPMEGINDSLLSVLLTWEEGGSVDWVDAEADWVDSGLVVGGDVHLMSRPVWISTAPSLQHTYVTVLLCKKEIKNHNNLSSQPFKKLYIVRNDVWTMSGRLCLKY